MLDLQRELQAQQWNTLHGINEQISETEKAQGEYQAKIKEVLARVSLSEEHKLKLEERLSGTRNHLSLLKEKNESVLLTLFS